MAWYHQYHAVNKAVHKMPETGREQILGLLVMRVRDNVTVDWSVKETAQTKLCVLVKRILCQFGYPPNLQDNATELVLQQADLMAAAWVSSGG